MRGRCDCKDCKAHDFLYGAETRELELTKEEKKAIVKALDEFEECAVYRAKNPASRLNTANHDDTHSKLLALLGITEDEWREM